MNKHNAKDYLPLVQALAEGKTIQVLIDNEWRDASDSGVILADHPSRYRIKPEPRKAWVWWPAPDMKYLSVTAFESQEEAEETKQYWQGRGHITEVTE